MSDGVLLLLGELGRYPVDAPNCLMRVVNWFLGREAYAQIYPQRLSSPAAGADQPVEPTC